MNHQEIKDKLFFLHDPEFPKQEQAEILSHLDECEECRLRFADWELFSAKLKKSAEVKPSSNFTVRVMDRIASIEESEKNAESPLLFPKWLMPLAGYVLAIFLMVMAIAGRGVPVNTESVLLSDIPQSSQWTFSSESPNIGQLFDAQRRNL